MLTLPMSLQVVTKSTLLLVHFQPTLCFLTWYYLYTLCPQPFSWEWLAKSDVIGAAQSALTCSFGWNYPADALISLLASEPQQLLPYDVLDSSVPLTALTADSVPIQAHPVLQPCIRFLTGISRYLNGQTLARHDQLTVSSRLHFLRALLLLQHLLLLIQPLATHSTDGPETVLVEVMYALLRHAPARLGFVDSSLATSASLAHQTHVQLTEPEEPPHLPQSTAFPAKSETQQHVFAVLQLSDRLLRRSLQKLLDASESQPPFWAVLPPTVSALAVAFQWSDSSGGLTFFSEKIGVFRINAYAGRLEFATAAPLHLTLLKSMKLHSWNHIFSRSVPINSWTLAPAPGKHLSPESAWPHMPCEACAHTHAAQSPHGA